MDSKFRSVIETVLGGVVLLFCIFCIFFSYKSARGISAESHYNINLKFQKIDGIDKGAAVKISGVSVGQVVTCNLESDYSVNVIVAVKRSVLLPIDSSAQIVTDGVMGGKYISISPGIESEYLANADVIEHTKSSVVLEDLISALMMTLRAGFSQK